MKLNQHWILVAIILAIILHPNIVYSDSIDTINRNKLNVVQIDQSIVDNVKENIQYISLFDISFCLPELLQIMKEKPSVKEDLSREVEKLNKLSSGMLAKKDLEWFRNRVFSGNNLKTIDPDGYDYLCKILPVSKNADTLTITQIKTIFKEAAAGGGSSEQSTIAFDLLIIDGENIVNVLEKTTDAKRNYETWLNALNKSGIFAPWTPAGILERKKACVLERYNRSENMLMVKTLNILKKTEIRAVD
jgi:hypothetical protein